MAEIKQNRECPVCVETFRKPVTLPCQHSFCRECIGLYADKCKSGQTDEAYSSTGSEDVPQVIPCPVCRAPTSLGKEGVVGLPLNVKLAETLERFAVDDNIPCCLVCEDDNKARADIYCTNCCVLYCEDCLESCHPMKGGLKRHRLITTQEYMSRETPESQLQTDKQSDPDLACERHGEPLVIYCVTCEDAICVGCLAEHPLHTTRDIQSACEEDKAPVMTKSRHLEKSIRELMQILPKFKGLHHDIQVNQNLHLDSIEKAYCAALDVLKAWRSNAIEAVKSRHTEWSVQCAAAVKHLEMEAEEMRMVQQSSYDFFSASNVQILKGSKQLSKRIDDLLDKIKTSKKKQEEIKQTLQESVNSYPVGPRRVIVTEAESEQWLIITKPQLKFTQTNDERLSITHSGSAAECEDLFEGWWCTAVTDGSYQKGRYYWELDITVTPCSPTMDCFCRVGVVHESCGVWRGDPGRESYDIWIRYLHNEISASSPCGGEIKPAYEQGRPYTESHHLGLYLDCVGRSLTIVNCVNNQLMYTVSDINLSQPMVPYVAFDYAACASARLVKADSTSLPKLLCDRCSLHERAALVEGRNESTDLAR
ncbi:probable E3 ubiquitin-protein ligase MID2 [Liolophura sinensis]|uniref:probable E3 ubiquitin-protein ligase MID2 n=1 Tax=Liolophura sinensis TaxID=3198878 RepID=UPI0031592D5A